MQSDMGTGSEKEIELWIIDIDGTLTRHNDDPNSRGIYDYHRAEEDLPNEPVIRIVRGLLALGDQVVFVTGRPESCRKETQSWINTHVVDWESDQVEGMYMRKTGDHSTPDAALKRNIYEKYLNGYYKKIAGVIEDRARVVKMWRDLGLTVLQTQEGDY